jgi:hypothetical protein
MAFLLLIDKPPGFKPDGYVESGVGFYPSPPQNQA